VTKSKPKAFLNLLGLVACGQHLNWSNLDPIVLDSDSNTIETEVECKTSGDSRNFEFL
jgi:hypothetical protein